MRKSVYIFGIVVVLVSFALNNISAQSNLPIHREFIELKNHLTKIWNLVQKFHNVKAKQLMIDAKKHLDLAEDYIYRRNDLAWRDRVTKARIEMAKARAFGEQAAKIVLRQPIQRLKAQLDDLINRADIEVSKNDNDEVRYLIHQAKKFRRKAYDAIAHGKTEKAQEFYQVAFFFVNKALGVMNQKADNIDNQIIDLKANIQLLIHHTDDIVTRNKNQIFQNLLEESNKYFLEANQLYETGRKEQALRKLRLIEKLLYRIIDQADRKSLTNKSKVENDLYSLNSFLDALESEVRENSNSRITLLFDKSKKLYTEAKHAFEAGQYEKAQLKISLSQRIATKILRLFKTGDDREIRDIKPQLEDAGRLLEIQAKPVEESGNQVLIKMYANAGNLLKNAQQNYENNNAEQAFQLLQVTTRITNRIQKLLDKKVWENKFQKSELERRLLRARTLLNKLKNNSELFKNYENIILQMEQFANEAEKYLQNNEYILAEEYIKSSLQQINLYTNKWSKQTE